MTNNLQNVYIWGYNYIRRKNFNNLMKIYCANKMYKISVLLHNWYENMFFYIFTQIRTLKLYIILILKLLLWWMDYYFLTVHSIFIVLLSTFKILFSRFFCIWTIPVQRPRATYFKNSYNLLEGRGCHFRWDIKKCLILWSGLFFVLFCSMTNLLNSVY